MPDQNASVSWWRGAAIYQIYPRSFRDTTGNGVGDLKGITQNLSYVRDLGVDAVWLSPFFRSPMKDFGYDVSDFRDVDPLFGSLADFDNLVSEAERLGLKIVIDQVYSHSSDQHPWFRESAASRTGDKSDWYVWADPKEDGSAPNNWMSIFGGPSWTWSSTRQQYYLHNFLSSQPDLNLHNEELQEEVLDTVRFWLERGVKGFRLDALHCSMHDQSLADNPPRPRNGQEIIRPYNLQWHVNDHSQPEVAPFLERLRQLTDQYDGAFTVAEVGADDALSVMKEYTSEGRLRSAYSFEFLWAPEISAQLVRDRVSAWPEDGREHWPSWAFSNHDAQRVVSRWDIPIPEADRAKLFALLLMSLRGNVFIYQGEELGLPQAEVPFEALQDPEAISNWPHTLGRDGARTPMPWHHREPHAGFSSAKPWLPVDPRHARQAVDVQDEDGPLAFFRDILALRQGSEALRLGSLRFTGETGDVLAFERQAGSERMLAVFNLSDRDGTAPMPAEGTILKSVRTVSADGAHLKLSPWSGVLIRLDD